MTTWRKLLIQYKILWTNIKNCMIDSKEKYKLDQESKG